MPCLRVLTVVSVLTGLANASVASAQPFGHAEDHWLRRCCIFGGESDRDPYEEPIETDRHDFTKTTKTVGRGVAQIEGGYLYFYKDTGEDVEQTHVTPELVLRYGLTDDIEFQVRWNYAWRFPEEEDSLDGAEDLRLAFKVALWDQDDWLPETTVIARMTAPTGGSAWTTEAVEAGGQVIYAWELCEGWELAGTTGGFTDGAGDVGFQDAELGQDDSFVIWAQSIALGIPVAPDISKAYLEWFGFWSYGLEDELTSQYLNIGVDVLLTDNVVVDFRVGTGLTDASEDFFAGVGGGVRF